MYVWLVFPIKQRHRQVRFSFKQIPTVFLLVFFFLVWYNEKQLYLEFSFTGITVTHYWYLNRLFKLCRISWSYKIRLFQQWIISTNYFPISTVIHLKLECFINRNNTTTHVYTHFYRNNGNLLQLYPKNYSQDSLHLRYRATRIVTVMTQRRRYFIFKKRHLYVAGVETKE